MTVYQNRYPYYVKYEGDKRRFPVFFPDNLSFSPFSPIYGGTCPGQVDFDKKRTGFAFFAKPVLLVRDAPKIGFNTVERITGDLSQAAEIFQDIAPGFKTHLG